MSAPALNLIVFTLIMLIVWALYKLYTSRGHLISKEQSQKALIEDILKQLYHVQHCNRIATISGLSGALKIKNSKVLQIILLMSKSGLVETVNDSIQLTTEGKSYALKMIRTHRLWEKYLAEKTGYQPSEWHFLAEKMEHELSEKEIEELSKTLGNPLFDPHGDPIPSDDGDLIPTNWVPLPTYVVNTPGKIAHIEDEPNVIYQQILAQRILVGSHIKVVESTKHQITLISEGNTHLFSPIVAANISIVGLSSDEVYEEEAERLSSLEEKEVAEVIGISNECRGANRRRLLDLGILQGTKIEVDLKSPLRDPIAYRVRNTSIALRNSLADLILIKKV